MLQSDFNTEFNKSIELDDLNSAHASLMRELGTILVKRKQDFVDLLNQSKIPASISDSDISLINLFVQNIDSNPKLALGTSLLIQMNNRKMNFDGDEELSDEGVKNGYLVLKSYYDSDEPYSNGAGVVTAIAKAAEAGLNLGTSVEQGKQKKRYGGQELAQRREESKQILIESVLKQRQMQIEAAKKVQED